MYLQRDVTPPTIGMDGMPHMGPVPISTANNGPVILAVTGAFTGFAGLVVILRMYVRAVMLKTVGTDDWLMVIAMQVLFLPLPYLG